jgi:hypothetical protein
VRPPNGNRDCVRHIQRYTGRGMEVRKMLQKQIGIIPDSVKTGSVQNVIQWKEKAERATKLLKNPRASVREMQDALEQLQRISK